MFGEVFCFHFIVGGGGLARRLSLVFNPYPNMTQMAQGQKLCHPGLGYLYSKRDKKQKAHNSY
jgi:hypothetical protein